MIEQDVNYRILSARRYALKSQTASAPQEALENVIVEDMATGTMCMVLNCAAPASDAALFYLDRASAAASDGILAIATESGVGRWIRLCPAYAPQ